jgi:hypothetical protein
MAFFVMVRQTYFFFPDHSLRIAARRWPLHLPPMCVLPPYFLTEAQLQTQAAPLSAPVWDLIVHSHIFRCVTASSLSKPVVF